MYVYLSKIVPLLVLPIGLVIELTLIAFLLVIAGKKKTSAFFLVLAMALLWGASMPYVAETLMGELEKDYPAVMMTEVPRSKCVVLLGGAVEPVRPPRVDIDLLDGADRVRKAAQLYGAGLAQLIIVSGGNQPWSPFEEPEAESVKTLLLEWGVPPEAIHLEENSRNTRENAFYSVELLEQLGCGIPLLVTSSAHMKRAVGAFERLRVEVFPVSTDVKVVDRPELTVFDFLPDAEALLMTNNAVREWLGRRVYELNGWN
jgi:uncharacterized SAM-binding protein YcdF (DUF218 family)